MMTFVALLRAVNVGGTGKLAMADVKALGVAMGLHDVRTYIASGNVLFRSPQSEAELKAALEARLLAFAGRKVGVILRTAGELADIAAGNPFPGAPGNRVMAIFLDRPVSPASLSGIVGQAASEEIRLGRREIYVHYGAGMATTRLRIPAAAAGTARNMNTVAALLALARS